MYSDRNLLVVDKPTQGLINEFLPERNKIAGLANLFYYFSDDTRLKLISILAISELCVTDISKILEINQTTVSHQLKVLAIAGIVEKKRQGKVIFYRLKDMKVSELMLKGVELL